MGSSFFWWRSLLKIAPVFCCIQNKAKCLCFFFPLQFEIRFHKAYLWNEEWRPGHVMTPVVTSVRKGKLKKKQLIYTLTQIHTCSNMPRPRVVLIGWRSARMMSSSAEGERAWPDVQTRQTSPADFVVRVALTLFLSSTRHWSTQQQEANFPSWTTRSPSDPKKGTLICCD